MIRQVAIMATLALVGLGGCNGGRGGPAAPAATGSPRALDLQVLPMAVNLDERPGPDAVKAIVYVYAQGSDAPGQVRDGSFEFLLFDGEPPPVAILSGAPARPLHVWRYSSQEMRQHLVRGVYGLWGYGMYLPWGADAPGSPKATIIVRYVPPSGPPVWSAPTTITVGQ